MSEQSQRKALGRKEVMATLRPSVSQEVAGPRPQDDERRIKEQSADSEFFEHTAFQTGRMTVMTIYLLVLTPNLSCKHSLTVIT